MSQLTSPMRAENISVFLPTPSILLAALVAVTFTLLGVVGLPHAAAAEEPGPTVEQILAAHVKALGGQAAIENVKSISRTGDLLFESSFSGSIEGRLEVDVVPKQKIYRAAELGAFSTTTAWNGEKAWEIGPQGQRELKGEELRLLADQSDIFYSTGLGRSADTKIELAGEEILDGVRHYRLLFADAHRSGVEIYLDAETHLISQVVLPMNLPGMGEVATVTDFFDYEPHEGLMMPKTVTATIEGFFSSETRFDSTTINGAIDAERFEISR